MPPLSASHAVVKDFLHNIRRGQKAALRLAEQISIYPGGLPDDIVFRFGKSIIITRSGLPFHVKNLTIEGLVYIYTYSAGRPPDIEITEKAFEYLSENG